jgi:hypothetical protein
MGILEALQRLPETFLILSEKSLIFTSSLLIGSRIYPVFITYYVALVPFFYSYVNNNYGNCGGFVLFFLFPERYFVTVQQMADGKMECQQWK